MKHTIGDSTFYILYGHLSLVSLNDLYPGKVFEPGEALAALGTPDMNVNNAPRLHFQLIVDSQGKEGDYPGVCKASELHFYQKNCPDPNMLLKT